MSDFLKVRAYVASTSKLFVPVGSYGMIIVSEALSDKYWGLRRAPSVTMEMHAAHRLLSAISEDGFDNAEIEIIAKSRHLDTRIRQALDRKEKIEAGRKPRFIENQDLWIEAAQLWHSHKVGLGLARSEEDKKLLREAKKLALQAWEPKLANEELLDDGAEISFIQDEQAKISAT